MLFLLSYFSCFVSPVIQSLLVPGEEQNHDIQFMLINGDDDDIDNNDFDDNVYTIITVVLMALHSGQWVVMMI